MTRINLGDKVKDPVSGLTGIAIARTEWLHGCIRITVQPQELKDGKPVDSYCVDEPQLEVLEERAVPNFLHWRDPGSPSSLADDSADAALHGRRAAGPRPEVRGYPDPSR